MTDLVITYLTNIGMAIGPIMGYVSQYRLIHETKQVGSFSIDICGILLFANILRLNFRIFEQYELTLVVQSIIMITMQVILLYQCAKYPQKAEGDGQQQADSQEESQPALSNTDSNVPCTEIEKFWRWNSFQKYGVTILFFTFCTFVSSGIMKATPLAENYGQLVGIVALVSESILILPQVIKNLQKKSTKGLSRMLVTLNLTGDILKLIYFVFKNQPFQFIMCGIIQVILDSYVIIQIFYYNNCYKKQEDSTGITSKKKSKQLEAMSPIKAKKIVAQNIQSEFNLNYDIKSMQSQRDKQNQMNPSAHNKTSQARSTSTSSHSQSQSQSQKQQPTPNTEKYYTLQQQLQNQEPHGSKSNSNSPSKQADRLNDNNKQEQKKQIQEEFEEEI